ncbi:MAG: acyl carrier protein [Candidatus Dependentiae bacterium]|nr:acyl carrier protein [Candidatus Dependentiae bacterium]
MVFRKEDTAAKVVAIVEEKLGKTRGLVTLNDSFDALGADSLDLVELIMSFEEEFGIEIKDEHSDKIKTVGNVVDYIHAMRTK